MIRGRFDRAGRPIVSCTVRLTQLGFAGYVDFLVDTGASVTALHPRDGLRLGIPFDELAGDSVNIGGTTGDYPYFPQPAELTFADSGHSHVTPIALRIAKPTEDSSHRIMRIPSLLGHDVLNSWRMDYDPRNNTLDFQV